MMETRAGYIAVGSAVLLLFAGVIGFVLWMANYDSATEYDRYSINFTGSVSGLRTGSTVSYRGIAVGEVVDLRIDPDNVEQVSAIIEIRANTPVKTSTVASVEAQGLTGGAMVMLFGGSDDDPPLAKAPDDDYPIIASVPSQLERLFEGAPALVEQIDLLVRQATLLLNTENRNAVAVTLENMASISRDLAAAAPALREMLATTNTTMSRIDRVAAAAEPDIKETLSATANTMRSAEIAMAEAEQAMAALGDTTETVNAILEENRRPLRDFTHVTLYDMNAFVAELRELTVSMRRVANELGRDPAGFIFGNQQRGYEAR